MWVGGAWWGGCEHVHLGKGREWVSAYPVNPPSRCGPEEGLCPAPPKEASSPQSSPCGLTDLIPGCWLLMVLSPSLLGLHTSLAGPWCPAHFPPLVTHLTQPPSPGTCPVSRIPPPHRRESCPSQVLLATVWSPAQKAGQQGAVPTPSQGPPKVTALMTMPLTPRVSFLCVS